jgi:hypothetical protein
MSDSIIVQNLTFEPLTFAQQTTVSSGPNPGPKPSTVILSTEKSIPLWFSWGFTMTVIDPGNVQGTIIDRRNNQEIALIPTAAGQWECIFPPTTSEIVVKPGDGQTVQIVFK